jgi:hypothetical protein
MTRNQLAKEVVKNISGNPIFTVDVHGKILPISQQSVDPSGSVLIQADSSGQSLYSGYICAWRSGACRCADIIADLGGEKHMKVTNPPTSYPVKSNATTGLEYTIYATPTDTGGGPSPLESNGDLRVGH